MVPAKPGETRTAFDDLGLKLPVPFLAFCPFRRSLLYSRAPLEPAIFSQEITTPFSFLRVQFAIMVPRKS